MKILALIPARGGSKGIKGKNIVKIHGKPLIAYTIETCLASRMINRVIVSTDDESIARVAEKYGAEVPFMRPREFARDLSPDIDVFYHALTWLKKNDDYMPDVVLNMRPVCPCRDVKVVDKAIRQFLKDKRADSLRAMCPSRENPYKMWKKQGAYLTPVARDLRFTESFNQPRQILPETYYQHGYVDMVRSSVILKQKCMSGKKVLPFYCENPVDIDYPEDLAIAKKLLGKRK